MITPEARAAFAAFGFRLVLFFLPASVAVLMGTVALRRIRTAAGRLRGAFLAAAGVATGFLTLLGIATAILLAYASMIGYAPAAQLGARLGFPVPAASGVASPPLAFAKGNASTQATPPPDADRPGATAYEARCTLRADPNRVDLVALCSDHEVATVASKVVRALELLALHEGGPALVDLEGALVVLRQVGDPILWGDARANAQAFEVRRAVHMLPSPGAPGSFYLIARAGTPERAIWCANAVALGMREVDGARRTAALARETADTETSAQTVRLEIEELTARIDMLLSDPTTAPERADIYRRIRLLEEQYADRQSLLLRLRRASAEVATRVEILSPAHEAYACE